MPDNQKKEEARFLLRAPRETMMRVKSLSEEERRSINSQLIYLIEQSLDKAIRMDFSQEWQNNAFGKLPEAVTKSFIQNLIEPNKNLITLGGKRWRPLLMMLCYQMAAAKNKPLVNIEQAYDFTQLVEFVHTASLIHDDIEDGADLRRGKPAAHITYGLDTSLNAASWLYFAAPICITNSTLTQESKL